MAMSASKHPATLWRLWAVLGSVCVVVFKGTLLLGLQAPWPPKSDVQVPSAKLVHSTDPVSSARGLPASLTKAVSIATR